MLKTVLFGFWSCAVTSGALFFALSNLPDPMEDAAMEAKTEAPSVYSAEPHLVIASVVHESKLMGFVISRLILEMDSKEVAAAKLPVEMVLQDGFNELVLSGEKLNFPTAQSFNISAFKTDLKQKIASVMGQGYVRNILVTQVEFIPDGESRRKQKSKPTKVLRKAEKETETPKKGK